MNVLFLDYDGVVNTPMWDDDGARCRFNFPDDGKVNNFQCVQWVSKFCQKCDYSIVVTSTWRFHKNYKECLIHGGLRDGIKILGRTPSGMEYRTRGDEIREWLSHRQVDNYMIFDDDSDFDKDLRVHLVKCNTFVGFTEVEYHKAVRMHREFVQAAERKQFGKVD